MRSLNTISSLF